MRRPLTATGTNLLGIVKHALPTEVAYFGEAFGRDWPVPGELVTPSKDDPQADWYATAQESSSSLVQLYGRVQRFADETIGALALDAVGHVAHWGGERVSLHEVMVHTVVDLQRHAGHADVLREQLDGRVGLLRRAGNVPDDVDWPACVAKLTERA